MGARGRSQVSPCQICDEQSGTGTGFSPRTSVFPCQNYSTNAPYSYRPAYMVRLPEGQTSEPGNFRTNQCLLCHVPVTSILTQLIELRVQLGLLVYDAVS
jgi:hypothetical protein